MRRPSTRQKRDRGILLKDLGDLKGAQKEFDRTLEINLAAYGPENPEVAVNLNNLGYLLKDKGDMDGAQAYFEPALKINDAAYGANHMSVVTYILIISALSSRPRAALKARRHTLSAR